MVKLSAFAVVGLSLGLLLTAQVTASAEGAPAKAAPAKAAPATHVSFRRDVAPLLVTSCTTASCHGGGAHPPDLDPRADASRLRSALLAAASEERPTLHYVKAGDVDASYLVKKIEGQLIDAECTDHDCGVRMPAKNPALSPAARTAIRAWIADGAPDN